jgi:hypothetical protein
MNRSPTSMDRVEAAIVELEQVNELLETFWSQRLQLYRAFRAIRTAQRNLAAVRAELGRNGTP